MDEQQTPAPEEAGDEVVADQAAQTEEESTEEKPEAEAEDGESGEGSEKEQMSPSKARRERRKAEMERLRTEKEAAEREAWELRQKLEQSGGNEPAPKREDFQDYEEWQAALAAHKVMSQLSARERAQLESQAKERSYALQQLSQREQAELAQIWADQESDARQRYADYDAVTRNPDLPITQAMVQMMAASDKGADIAYHFGTNPQEAARIAQLPPMQMAREMGLIEAKVSLPKAPTQTQAPDPVKPVKPKATATKDPAKMSMSEYIAARNSGQLR